VFGRSTLTRHCRRRSVRCNPPRSSLYTTASSAAAASVSTRSAVHGRWWFRGGSGGGEVNLRARASRKKLNYAVGGGRCVAVRRRLGVLLVVARWADGRSRDHLARTSIYGDVRGDSGEGVSAGWRTSGVMTVPAASRDFSEQRQQRRIFPGCRRRFGVDPTRTRSLEGRDGRVDPVCSPGPGPTPTRQTTSRSPATPALQLARTHTHTHTHTQTQSQTQAQTLHICIRYAHTHTIVVVCLRSRAPYYIRRGRRRRQHPSALHPITHTAPTAQFSHRVSPELCCARALYITYIYIYSVCLMLCVHFLCNEKR